MIIVGVGGTIFNVNLPVARVVQVVSLTNRLFLIIRLVLSKP
jgi:hypothetical protein